MSICQKVTFANVTFWDDDYKRKKLVFITIAINNFVSTIYANLLLDKIAFFL
jgi:hypothetical protein